MTSDLALFRFDLRVDWLLASCALILMLLGVVMVGSASFSMSERIFGSPYHYLIRQSLFAFMGLFLILVVGRVSLLNWQNMRMWMLVISLVLLLLVFVPGLGKTVNGSTRWLDFGLFRFQVSELVKLLMLVYLSGYMVAHQEEVRQKPWGVLKPLLVFVLVAILMLIEPDFGAAVVLLATMMGVVFLAGARLWLFGILSALGAAVVLWLSVSAEYRLARITSFLDPWADPYDKGFQLTQSLIAIGSGSWTGTGLGGSVQKLFYLPEAHTDFLFAILAEELGLIGVSMVIVLFSFLVWRAFQLAHWSLQAEQPFAAYLSYGLGIWIGLQAFVNIGVNMGVLPTKGLTLPLMSYGGSSTLVMCLVIGLLLRVYHELPSEITTPKEKAS
ncbi:MAG: putative lipid II flippase FtsW [Gammaproteobacteria bacterium]|nr:putative lipid II flippase FtsW [Gammaproteobacteria bacterium]